MADDSNGGHKRGETSCYPYQYRQTVNEYTYSFGKILDVFEQTHAPLAATVGTDMDFQRESGLLFPF